VLEESGLDLERRVFRSIDEARNWLRSVAADVSPRASAAGPAR